jgi:t-SNARE complex subunit (syntaxin)
VSLRVADNIESNMSAADSNVESGTQQLGQASRYQKKARNKACMCLLIVAIILAILVVVVVTSLKK